MSDPGSPGRGGDSLARQVVLVLVLCALVFWVRLGADGLSASEGHRAIPGWEMLESGDWLIPTMFDQAYLRKPPGMTWAVATSSWILGQTEFAARAVSAAASTLMALLSLVFARRWFGSRFAVSAGVTFALTPWFWQAGRSAEIEALNNLFIQIAVLILIDRLVFAPRNIRNDVVATLGAGLAIGAALLTKGPIGAGAAAAAIVGECIASRSMRPLSRPMPWVALAIGGACFALWAFAALSALDQIGVTAVTQNVESFLWNPDRILGVVTLAPIAFASALPLSLTLLFPFGPDATREFDDPGNRELHVARALAWGCVISLVALTISGVSNPRYAMPAFVTLGPLVAYVLRGLSGEFSQRRRAIARTMVLGRPLILCAALIIAAGAWILAIEPRRDSRSGREAGLALAHSLPDGATVLVDHLVEARPEVLWYARRLAQTEGRSVEIRWVPQLSMQERIFGGPEILVLRTDDESGEAQFMRDNGAIGALRELASGSVHKFTFTAMGP